MGVGAGVGGGCGCGEPGVTATCVFQPHQFAYVGLGYCSEYVPLGY